MAETDLLLDEDVRRSIADALEGSGVSVSRYRKGATDRAVLMEAVENTVPVLTRNQGDFVTLGNEMDHP
ncbi:MAG: DUF5615 family PIN-like protein, partial [Candidatus Nanohaloarchaea archaeon]